MILKVKGVDMIKKSMFVAVGPAIVLGSTASLVGCQRPFTATNVKLTVITPVGPAIVEIDEIRFGPAMNPPPGVQFDCHASHNGVPVKLYTDPATGEQWMQDNDGDWHLNEGDVIDCNPVFAPGAGGFEFTNAGGYSFDEAADTATVTFTLPASAAALYQPASNMYFAATETIITAFNGDMEITYQGSINDVLGCMWNLGVEHAEFGDKIAGYTVVSWSTEFNSVHIDTDSGSRTIVLVPTQFPNQ